MVVVVVLLQVGVVLRAKGHRRGKGVNEDLLPRQSGQLFVEAGGEKVRHRSTPAVAAHPELDKAQSARLLGCGQIILQIGEHLVHRDDKAAVGMACAGVQVAHPLAAIAAAPQDERHDGGTPAIQGDGLAGGGPAHEVTGLAHVDVVVAILCIAVAQLRIGRIKAVLAAHIPVGPVFRLAGPCIERCTHHAQRGQRQLMVILEGRVRKKAVAVVIFVLDVHLAQLAAERQAVFSRRHRAAYRLALHGCHGPGQSPPGRKSGTTSQRFAEITSFHVLCPLAAMINSILSQSSKIAPIKIAYLRYAV